MDTTKLPTGHIVIEEAPNPVPSPKPAHPNPSVLGYKERAREANVDLDYAKRHRFGHSYKAAIFEDFDHARATVRGTRKALVVVDAEVRGAIALDRDSIERVVPECLAAYDHLIGMKKERDQDFDADKDLVVLFASDPRPEYHGTKVDGFLVWRVAGTCHFRQYPAPGDARVEKRAFGSQGE